MRPETVLHDSDPLGTGDRRGSAAIVSFALSFQKRVFLEDRDCARPMLKNQAFARAVPRWVLEGCGFDAVAALFATVITSALHVIHHRNLTQGMWTPITGFSVRGIIRVTDGVNRRYEAWRL